MSMTSTGGRFSDASPAVHGRHDLIGSDRVEGTNVYRSDGKKIGEIERVMLDKLSGQIAYAVMSFGGFLGLGEDHYPIPWQRLKYNEKLGGYEVNITDEQLKNAPHYATGEEWKWDRTQGKRSYDYYGVPPYWPLVSGWPTVCAVPPGRLAAEGFGVFVEQTRPLGVGRPPTNL